MADKYKVQNPMDSGTCGFCKIMNGTEVEDIEKAVGVPFAECEHVKAGGDRKCRCYVAKDSPCDMAGERI